VIETPTRRQVVSFNSLILASGDLVGGGLAIAGREVVDPFSTFKVGTFGETETLPGQTQYDLAMRRVVEAGYLVTNEMRLMNKEGKPFENAFGAGSALASFSFPTGVGLGGELLTAWVAAEYAKEVS
jgi:anaerobic glycerol-3-phosphate dehydrogenase